MQEESVPHRSEPTRHSIRGVFPIMRFVSSASPIRIETTFADSQRDQARFTVTIRSTVELGLKWEGERFGDNLNEPIVRFTIAYWPDQTRDEVLHNWTALLHYPLEECFRTSVATGAFGQLLDTCIYINGGSINWGLRKLGKNCKDPISLSFDVFTRAVHHVFDGRGVPLEKTMPDNAWPPEWIDCHMERVKWICRKSRAEWAIFMGGPASRAHERVFPHSEIVFLDDGPRLQVLFISEEPLDIGPVPDRTIFQQKAHLRVVRDDKGEVNRVDFIFWHFFSLEKRLDKGMTMLYEAMTNVIRIVFLRLPADNFFTARSRTSRVVARAFIEDASNTLKDKSGASRMFSYRAIAFESVNNVKVTRSMILDWMAAGSPSAAISRGSATHELLSASEPLPVGDEAAIKRDVGKYIGSFNISRPWTKKDDERLALLSRDGTLSVPEISETLHRPTAGVGGRTNILRKPNLVV